jgi:hypothetical protein
MTKRKRKIPAVNQLQYMKEHNEGQCDIKFQNTDGDRIMFIINQKCAYPDEAETFQLLRALHRVGTVQFGKYFHDQCLSYMDGVTVIEEAS